MSAHLKKFLLSVLFTGLFGYLSLGPLGQGQAALWRERLLDLQWQWLPRHTLDDSVAIVDIDDGSLAAIGRWPWPRETVANLIESLFRRYQVSAVGLDILFPEAATSGDGDARLAALGQQYPLVFAQVFELDSSARRQGRLHHAQPCPAGLAVPQAYGYLGLSPTLGQQHATGHISPLIDADGSIRRAYPLLAYQQQCYPSLALALMDTLSGYAPGKPGWQYRQGQLRHTATDLALPVQADGTLRLNYADRFAPQYPASAVLDGSLPAHLLQNRIILIGSSAAGLGDIVVTPVNNRLSGVQIHATVLDMLLQQRTPVRPAWAVALALLLTFTLSWLLLSSRRHRQYRVLLPAAAIMAGWLWLVWWLWQRGIDLPALPLLGSLVLLLPLRNLWQSVAAQLAEQRLLRQFSAYLPREVLQQLVESGADPRKLKAQRHNISVMFADIRGFTPLAEQLPPEQLAQLLNIVMDYLAQRIQQHQGLLDKFIGDAVMAFWGAPQASSRHADDALACALAIRQDLPLLNARLAEQGLPAVRFTIGINTGPAAVGNMGSQQRRAYTAVGDTVNLASRLQDLCRKLDQDILLGENTCRQLQTGVLQSHGRIQVRGRQQPEQVASPL